VIAVSSVGQHGREPAVAYLLRLVSDLRRLETIAHSLYGIDSSLVPFSRENCDTAKVAHNRAGEGLVLSMARGCLCRGRLVGRRSGMCSSKARVNLSTCHWNRPRVL